MNLSEKLSVIEAILFACGEPVESERLAASADVDAQELPRLISSLNARYSDSGSALEVLTIDRSYQLATKKDYASFIRTAMETKKNAALSRAAMEVLTIIAYNQPVTRSFVDDVRGVDSGGVLNNLLEKDLVCEAGRLDIPGRPILFKTSDNFLRCFGISSIAELPPLPTEDSQLSFEDVESEAVD